MFYIELSIMSLNEFHACFWINSFCIFRIRREDYLFGWEILNKTIYQNLDSNEW